MIGADVDAVSDAVAPGLALLAHAVAANAMSTNMPRTRTRRGVASARHRVACTVSPTRRPTRPHSANCRPPSLPLNHQLTDRIPDTWTAEPALVAELDLLAERIQGVQRWYTEPVRSPAGWLRTRLADWLDGEGLSLIHISEPTRRTPISYAVFCLKKTKAPTRIYAV